MSHATQSFTVNQRVYQPPARPVVVVCLDGSADAYLDAALARDLMPNLKRFCVEGFRGTARAAMPTFTNVNNTSIVTGAPPSVHGISGNYFYHADDRAEVMMNSAEFLRCPTVFPAAQRAGRQVAVVTAKEKLRDIFASGLIEAGGIAFSAEKAAEARNETHGIDDVELLAGDQPAIYSGAASLYVLHAGVRLLREDRADFLYLSTTDYIQHAHGPDEPEALDFYAAIDRHLGELAELGAVIGITADHGMNAKQRLDGSPHVFFLESALEEAFEADFRVILPITDPYVAHHGALGSFAVVHLPPTVELNAVSRWLSAIPGVTEVHDRAAAARLLQLPADRIGDLVVVAGRDVVLGRTPADHDLSQLHGGLRSHGGRYEEIVPLIFSRPLKPMARRRAEADPRNFDIFELTLNGTET